MQGLAARLNLKRSQGRPWAGYRAAKRVEFRGADPVRGREGNILPPEWLGDEEPRAVGDPMHVETSFVRNLGDLIHVRPYVPGRLGKARSRTPSMHVNEKSDEAIVLKKRPNKGRQLLAEVVEGRASPKGNSHQAAAVRTLRRASASIRRKAVRRATSESSRLSHAV